MLSEIDDLLILAVKGTKFQIDPSETKLEETLEDELNTQKRQLILTSRCT